MAVILVLSLVLGGVGALDNVATVIVRILQIVFNPLVHFINLFRRIAQEHRLSRRIGDEPPARGYIEDWGIGVPTNRLGGWQRR